MVAFDSLATASALGFVTGLVYAGVGAEFHPRSVREDARGAVAAFRAAWFALAAYTLAGATRGFAGAFGWLNLNGVAGAFILMQYVQIALLCVGFWGFASFVAYLLTGRRRATWVMAVVFGTYTGMALVLFAGTAPSTVVVNATTTSVATSPGPAADALGVLFFLGLAVQLVGAVAYAALAWRVREPVARFRISVVALSLAVWFVSPLVVPAVLADPVARDLTLRAIGLVAAFGLLIAYRPLAVLLRRFGVVDHSVVPDLPTHKDAPQRPIMSASALERAEELL